MGVHEAWLLEQNLESVDVDTLRKIAYELRDKNAALQQDLMRTKLDGEQTREDDEKKARKSESEVCECPFWLWAERDYPSPTSTVIVFDAIQGKLEIETAETLYNKRVVISQLPRRWCRTLYVFEESLTQANQHSVPRVRVTTDSEQCHGLLFRYTIHLSQLPREARTQMLLGQIRWIFIIRLLDSGTSLWPSAKSQLY